MLKDIIAVKPLDDYQLFLQFEDGIEGVIWGGGPLYVRSLQFVVAQQGTCWKKGDGRIRKNSMYVYDGGCIK